MKKIPATKSYMDMYRASQDTFDNFDFPNDAARAYINDARDMKAFVTHAANTLLELPMLEAYDAKPQSEKRKTQHFYSDIINRFRAKEIGENLKDNGPLWENARFLSNDGSMAGAWLFNVPTHRQLTMITSSEFRFALKIRLGVDFNTLPSHCCCVTKKEICKQGIHMFCCNDMRSFVLQRHNALKDEVMQLAKHVREGGSESESESE